MDRKCLTATSLRFSCRTGSKSNLLTFQSYVCFFVVLLVVIIMLAMLVLCYPDKRFWRCFWLVLVIFVNMTDVYLKYQTAHCNSPVYSQPAPALVVRQHLILVMILSCMQHSLQALYMSCRQSLTLRRCVYLHPYTRRNDCKTFICIEMFHKISITCYDFLF